MHGTVCIYLEVFFIDGDGSYSMGTEHVIFINGIVIHDIDVTAIAAQATGMDGKISFFVQLELIGRYNYAALFIQQIGLAIVEQRIVSPDNIPVIIVAKIRF